MKTITLWIFILLNSVLIAACGLQQDIQGKWQAEPFDIAGFTLPLPVANEIEITENSITFDGRLMPIKAIHVDKQQKRVSIELVNSNVGYVFTMLDSNRMIWSPLGLVDITYVKQ